jgi:hypothetical protein
METGPLSAENNPEGDQKQRSERRIQRRNLVDRAGLWLLVLFILLLIGLAAVWIRISPGQDQGLSPAETTIPPAEGSSTPASSNNAPVSDPAAGLEWFAETVDPNPKSGIFSSLLLAQDGSQYIAYLDDSSDDLKLAAYDGTSWDLQSNLDASDGQDGWYPALASDRQGRLHVSYYAISEQQIIYGSRSGAGEWQFEVAVDGVSALDTSLAVTGDGIPHVVFFDETAGQVRHAAKDGNGWVVSTVGDGAKEGFSFPVIVDQEDGLHVAFQGSGGGLVHARLVGGAWSSEVVDASAGGFPALALDGSGRLHASYFAPANQDLKYAYQDGDAWRLVTVDSAGNTGKFTSIAVDSQGYAHISYYDEDSSALKYAYGQNERWKTTVVNDEGEVGRYNALILDHDNPRISYYDESAQILMVAHADVYNQPTGQPGRLFAQHRSGQTFLTWLERSDLRNEVYQVYRSDAPIDRQTIGQATLLAQVGEGSSIFWANSHEDDGVWGPRLSRYLVISDGAPPVGKGKGVFVWTLSPEDADGSPEVAGYYAVTIVEAGSGEEQFDEAYTVGPVQEAVRDPEPVEITASPGVLTQAESGGHYYIQYMDFRNWNPTFHAPNSTNNFYGLDPGDPIRDHALAYSYDYTVFEPTPELCGGSVPDTLPVMVFLHGARGNRYGAPESYPYPYCAYGVYPIDESETWYYGFARQHDYRIETAFDPGDRVVNYTEQRILRMVYDLIRTPPGPSVDTRRIYLFGHSMGGTGSMAFAQRYPNVFAAIYSGQPVTHFYATEGYSETWPANLATKWGPQELNLPISISAPNRWADHLQKYDGTGVFEWENLRAAFDPGDRLGRFHEDMVPFGIDHGTVDDAVLFPTQGRPIYPLLNGSTQAWAGAVTDATHEWSSFGWPLPAFAKVEDVPFWNLSVVLNETVPGLRLLSGSAAQPPEQPTTYHQTVLWSASWNPWDGAPKDLPGEWQMSFCSVKEGSTQCGDGAPVLVDITPRRLQQFQVTPGQEYRWENRQVEGDLLIDSGTVTADQYGVLTVLQVQILPDGNRIRIFSP